MKDEVIVLKDGEWNNAIEIPVLAKIDTIRIHNYGSNHHF
jgi:hypothetical protein